MNRFTKISSTGEELAADRSDHVAVLDVAAGLMWSVENLGGETSDGAEVSHHQAAELTAAYRLLDHADWRLPTIEELFMLADRTRRDPAINTDAFPQTQSDWYWSSSLLAGDPDYAWFVNFSYGNAYCLHRDYYYGFVRAVRSVAPVSPGQ